MNSLHSVIAIQRVQKLCSQITVRDHALKPNSCCSAWLITESSPKCCWGMHISLNQQQRTLNTVAENTFQTILFRRHLWSTWNVCLHVATPVSWDLESTDGAPCLQCRLQNTTVVDWSEKSQEWYNVDCLLFHLMHCQMNVIKTKLHNEMKYNLWINILQMWDCRRMNKINKRYWK